MPAYMVSNMTHDQKVAKGEAGHHSLSFTLAGCIQWPNQTSIFLSMWQLIQTIQYQNNTNCQWNSKLITHYFKNYSYKNIYNCIYKQVGRGIIKKNNDFSLHVFKKFLHYFKWKIYTMKKNVLVWDPYPQAMNWQTNKLTMWKECRMNK